MAGADPLMPSANATAKAFPRATNRAVRVAAVEANSPAALGGIKEGDLVIRLGDSPIAGLDDLQRHLTMSQVGVRTPVSVIRGTDQLMLEIVPVETAHKSRD